MAGISVGSVSVDIVPDTTNFRRELNAKLKDLSAPVRLDLNDKAFKAELDAATRNREVNVHVDDHGSINQMRGRTHNLIAALALLAPAAAPLTAVAIGGAAALTGLGAAGILAFKGIQAEMKAGTTTGLAYTTQIASLKTGLSTLEKTAASGVLAGFTDATTALTAQMPVLNRQVDYLAHSIGSDLAPVTRGLTGLFTALFPTTKGIADGIHTLAVNFEGWANGPGGRAFADYLARELPIVVDTLAALGTAGAHVVQALLPMGGPVLAAIKGVSDVISKLPVEVIEALFIAFAAYKVVTLAAAAATGFQAAIARLGLTASATTLKIGALTEAEAAAAAASGGLIGKLGPAALGAGLGVSGLKALPLFGVGAQSDIITDDPISRGKANFYAEHPNAGKTGFSDFITSTKNNPAAGAQLKAYMSDNYKAKSATDSLNGSVKSATTSLAAEAAAVAALGKKMDDTFAKSAGVKSAQIGLAQAAADATASLKENGRTLDLNTQKGRDNRTALLNLATATHTKIDADIAAGKPQKAITADIVDGHHQLEIMARKFGLSKDAAKRYADSLLAVPRNVLTTVTVNGIAKSAAQVAALKRQLGTGAFYAGQKGGATGGLFSDGEFLRRDSGGPVWGAGSSTSDSIPALLSNGEFVIKAATVKAVGAPFLHKLNDTGMAAGSGSAPIYVQNPFTGEYLLAQVDARTSSAMRAEGRRVSAGRR